ncbi:hypothetical protein I4U23_010752 [Adineta vaga]|nr:hypothetical protein I4U23_010752 [Adineta vaga]
MKIHLTFILLILSLIMISYTNGEVQCKCCFVLTSPNCQTKSMKSCLQCNSAWCNTNAEICGELRSCYARCNATSLH